MQKEKVKHIPRDISIHSPIHVISRTHIKASLQEYKTILYIREVIKKASKKYCVNIFQHYVSATHIHFFLYTGHRENLGKAMQYINARIATHMNVRLGRKHRPFWADRFYSSVKRSAREIRNTIYYVARQEPWLDIFKAAQSSLAWTIDKMCFGFPKALLNAIGTGCDPSKLKKVILEKGYAPYGVAKIKQRTSEQEKSKRMPSQKCIPVLQQDLNFF